jgi:outer membrane lipoprotein SlyB
MKKQLLTLLVLGLTVSGCVTNGQNNYAASDVGKQTVVEFGRVVAVRTVDITGKNSGVGMVGGGVAGAAIGGTGNGGSEIAGLAVGAIAGAVTEQVIANRHGTEYTIALRNKKVITIVQEIHDEDPIFPVGARVIVQSKGSYQRVLSADDLPGQIHRANGIKQVNDTGNDDAAMDSTRHIKINLDTDEDDSVSASKTNNPNQTNNNKGN